MDTAHWTQINVQTSKNICATVHISFDCSSFMQLLQYQKNSKNKTGAWKNNYVLWPDAFEMKRKCTKLTKGPPKGDYNLLLMCDCFESWDQLKRQRTLLYSLIFETFKM